MGFRPIPEFQISTIISSTILSTWYSSGKMELSSTFYFKSTSMNKTRQIFRHKELPIHFGDIFLEDFVNTEEQLNTIGMKAVFPLWKKNTSDLIQEFLDLGFKTIVTCVNGTYLDKSFAGRIIDQQFLDDLPDHVDPCGENEFHTFTFDGPIFKNPVRFDIGETVKKLS
jgi:uncharacterized protein (TIGR00290 family)